MPIPDDIVADMLRSHTDRMHAIAGEGVAKAQAMGAKLLESVRDPLQIKAEALSLSRGEMPYSEAKPV